MLCGIMWLLRALLVLGMVGLTWLLQPGLLVPLGAGFPIVALTAEVLYAKFSCKLKKVSWVVYISVPSSCESP
jgi:hypothetical protein